MFNPDWALSRLIDLTLKVKGDISFDKGGYHIQVPDSISTADAIKLGMYIGWLKDDWGGSINTFKDKKFY